VWFYPSLTQGEFRLTLEFTTLVIQKIYFLQGSFELKEILEESSHLI
jgi:hypothetical protein